MKLLRVSYTKSPGVACQSCGHTPIHNLYEIRTDNGEGLTVGSECATKLLRFDVMSLCKRYNGQASREWKEQNPKPQEGELRGDFIARRINEKFQARKAWHEWQSMNAQHHWLTNPWQGDARQKVIIGIEQKHGVGRADWENKTAYTI